VFSCNTKECFSEMNGSCPEDRHKLL